MFNPSTRESEASNPIVCVENLCVELPDFSLSVANFSASEGTLVAVAGPNGSGKSIFLKIVAGLYYEYAGMVSRAVSRMQIGYADNHAKFIEDLTVTETLRFCHGAVDGWNDEQSRRLTALLGLEVSRQVRTLSSGNRAKLSLIVALSQQAQLLVFDEPFAFLDERCRRELATIIDEYKRIGVCVVVASHDFGPIQDLVGSVVCFENGVGKVGSALAELVMPGGMEEES